ncbi:MAG TPA: relaxase/mobilization nuclease domain-containing protein [Allosphingosinicella sp.]|nr:relaxase/mobilization nuclease domain-containing protein [Allosphingosinicella sp.]
MILKASQRGGGRQLGLHLLKTEENEHVEVHEVSGFVGETVRDAMKEAHALSRGTHCQQYLFSVSLNPPAGETARLDTFEQALRMIEDRTGLAGQPRVVVFHEKEGRRHCHAVWSRIDAATMTAKHLPFFKSKLREVARQLFLENGW